MSSTYQQHHQRVVRSSDVSINDASISSEPTSPGLLENFLFECDSSVTFWREFSSNDSAQQLSLQSIFAELASVASRFAQKGPDALSYWIKHTGRSSYFVGNALLGNLGHQLHERFANKSTDDISTKKRSIGGVLPLGMNSTVAFRLLLRPIFAMNRTMKKLLKETIVSRGI